jgi:hypothetical protein
MTSLDQTLIVLYGNNCKYLSLLLVFKNAQLSTFGEAFKMFMSLTKLYGVIYHNLFSTCRKALYLNLTSNG